jgi:AcrR family transcriptional regulator
MVEAMAEGESRRHSILEAMVRVAGRKGYREATVSDAIAEAGVSRTTFYKHFDDKHECFLAAYDMAAERALAAIEAGCAREATWAARAYRGLESLVDILVAEPDLARTVVVEPTIGGVAARRRQLATTARIALSLETARRPEDSDLPANTALMAVGAVTGLLFDEIQAGRTAQLRERLSHLLFALLVPYVGPQQAAEEAWQAGVYAAASR